MRILRWMDVTLQDLRYAARILTKHYWLTIIVVFTLALGVGVNTAIFTLLDRLYFLPLPVRDSGNVVEISLGHKPSFTTYAYLRDHTKTLSGLVAYQFDKLMIGAQNTSDEPQEITAKFVSGNFFSVLGTSPLLGRNFSPEEVNSPGREPLVVLSYHFWQKRFNADQNIVGKTVKLNDIPFVIIGVTTHEFAGFGLEESLVPPDVWLPLMMRNKVKSQDTKNVDYFGPGSGKWLELSLAGRLNASRTTEEARAEMTLLIAQIARDLPERRYKGGVTVLPLTLTGARTTNAYLAVTFVMSATAILLLVACANIINLLLSRSVARRKEIGLRICLGVSPGRMIWQLLTESLLLAGPAGIIGLLLAWWSVKAFMAKALFSSLGEASDFNLLNSYLNPDVRVLGYTFIITVVAGVVVGLIPALSATHEDLTVILKDEPHSFGHNSAKSRLPNAIIVVQVALCLMLLIAAGLITRGLDRIREDKVGINTKNVLAVEYNPSSRFNQLHERQFIQELTDRLEAIPGVQSLTQTRAMPLDNMKRVMLVLEEEGEAAVSQISKQGNFNQIAQNYFGTLGIPIIRGRDFTAEEIQNNAAVVVVSESTVRNLWPDQEPIGKELRLDVPGVPLVQVIGVARDIRNLETGETYPLFIYAPLPPPSDWGRILVRTVGDPKSIKSTIMAISQKLNPPTFLTVRTMPEYMAEKESVSLAPIASIFLAGLGLLTLLLVVIGLYGVISYSVTQRTREIGIRIALGASRRNVLWLVVGQSMRLVAVGIAMGIGGGIAVSRLLRSLMFGLSPFDPLTYLGVSLFLAVITMAAAYLPASRAAGVDPMIALRHY